MSKKTMLAVACAASMLMAPQASVASISNESAPDKSWYSIKNQGGNVEILIYDEIGGWGITAKQFIRELNSHGKVNSITARIHSPGGDVFEGMAIYNIIKNHPAHKVCHIDGLAASMGSVIAMAFDEIIMPENAMMMIHKPWGGTMGDADDMRKYADLLDQVEGSLVGAYKNKTNLDETELHELLAEETWLTGAEAVEKGFADTLSEPLQMAAALNSKRLKDFENMPEALKKLFAPQGNANPNTPAAPQQPAAVIDPQPTPAEPTQAQIDAAATAQNQARIDGINAAFKAFPQLTELKASCLGNAAMTADGAKDAILAELGKGTTSATPTPKSTIIHAGNGNIVGDSVRQHLMARAGHEERQRDNAYSSYNLKELARASLQDRGIAIAGMNQLDMVGMAFTHSTSDFGQILLDVANKSVLAGWDGADETFDRWTKRGQLGDFKVSHRVGLNELGSLREVREGAEYKHITIGDRGEQIMLATYGEIFTLTRQAIINDDMMMLTDIPFKMGEAAKATVGDLVYAVLTGNKKLSDGKALFHNDHKNTFSGPLDVKSLDTGRTQMRRQKMGERNLNIRPAYALSPVSIESQLNQVIGSTSVKGTDANSSIINPIKDFVEVIGEPRLDDHNVNEYYLAAAQGRDTIEVAYLDGIDTPFIEQQQGFSVDGVATKVRMDAGVAPLDFRGLQKGVISG